MDLRGILANEQPALSDEDIERIRYEELPKKGWSANEVGAASGTEPHTGRRPHMIRCETTYYSSLWRTHL